MLLVAGGVDKIDASVRLHDRRQLKQVGSDLFEFRVNDQLALLVYITPELLDLDGTQRSAVDAGIAEAGVAEREGILDFPVDLLQLFGGKFIAARLLVHAEALFEIFGRPVDLHQIFIGTDVLRVL